MRDAEMSHDLQDGDPAQAIGDCLPTQGPMSELGAHTQHHRPAWQGRST